MTVDAVGWLETGLDSGNQSILAKGIQVFINLQTLPEVLATILQKYHTTLSDLAKATYDMISLNAEMSGTASITVEMKKSGVTGSSSSSLSAWAAILWARTEKLTDVIYSHTSKIHTLESYLCKRNDPVTHVKIMTQVEKATRRRLEVKGKWSLRAYFWCGVCGDLDGEIKNATRQSQFLLQVLQAGYPKLLRIFLDLFSRIKLITGDDRCVVNLI